MGRYVFVVYTRPLEGRDAEYNDWYSNVHVPDVERLDGVLSARRYRLAPMTPEQSGHPPYLALYELELDDASGFPDQIRHAIQAGQMPISEAMDTSGTITAYYEAIQPH